MFYIDIEYNTWNNKSKSFKVVENLTKVEFCIKSIENAFNGERHYVEDMIRIPHHDGVNYIKIFGIHKDYEEFMVKYQEFVEEGRVFKPLDFAELVQLASDVADELWYSDVDELLQNAVACMLVNSRVVY